MDVGYPEPFIFPQDEELEEILESVNNPSKKEFPCPCSFEDNQHNVNEDLTKKEFIVRCNLVLEKRGMGLLCVDAEVAVRRFHNRPYDGNLTFWLVPAYAARRLRYFSQHAPLARVSANLQAMTTHLGSVGGAKLTTTARGIMAAHARHAYRIHTAPDEHFLGDVSMVPTRAGYVKCSLEPPGRGATTYRIQMAADFCHNCVMRVP